MAVETTTRKVTQTMNKDITEYTFTFRALAGSPADIKCIRETIADGTLEDMTYVADLPEDPTEADALKYTVEVNDDGIGGTITVAYAATGFNDDTFKITIYRQTTQAQGSVYDDYNQFPAKTVENDFDRGMMLIQEIEETLGRTITVPITEEDPPDYASLLDDAKAAAEDAAQDSQSWATLAMDLYGDLDAVNQAVIDSSSHATTALTHSTTAGSYATIAQDAAETLTVVDNLTSTSSTSALSANQGKTLNDKFTSNIETKTENYTFVLTDAGNIVIMNSASARIITIPANASVEFPIGTMIAVFRYGTGDVTIGASSGVTRRSMDAAYKLAGQYAGAVLIKTDTDTWSLEGNLEE